MGKSRWFLHAIRVRYAETDKMGVVYHVNYANWFEYGRTELIRELGISYRELEEQGLLLPVVDLHLQFMQPARYDDRIAIYTSIADFTNVRITFETEIYRIPEGAQPDRESSRMEPAGDKLVTGTTTLVWVGRNWKPARLDREAPDVHRLLLRETEDAADSE